MSPQKRKVAVLGSGMAAMSAVFELTQDPAFRDQYDVTVYQMGWRAGGKGASGRNPEYGNRIEEHGLHFWLGFYQNAFRLIRQCYAEANRPLTEAMATWSEALKPSNQMTLEENVDGKWYPWLIEFPANDLLPGDAGHLPSLWEVIGMVLRSLRSLLRDTPVPGKTQITHETFLAEVRTLTREVEVFAEGLFLTGGAVILEDAEKLVNAAFANSMHLDTRLHAAVGGILEQFLKWLWSEVEESIDQDTELRHLWIVMDLGISAILGMLADGVLTGGIKVIDQYDFREWLSKHGATDITVNSAIIKALYDLIFAENDTASAAVMLHGTLRLLFMYSGSIYWRMQSGMGDVIFAPLYEVLKQRGVKFKFFHRATNVGLAPDKKSVASITLAQQVTLKDGDYDPFITVKRMKCWPSHPNYDQIVEGRELQKQKIDLESYWSPWKDVGSVELHRGTDFDDVILGVSLASIPIVAAELVAALPKWKALVDNVKTTTTQASQLWCLPDIAGLGWSYWTEDRALVTSYAEPLDTWADMSHLLVHESWPDDQSPLQISYLCGGMKDPGIPPPSDTSFPARMRQAVYDNTVQFLKTQSQELIPQIVHQDGQIQYDLLADAKDGKGEERLQNQYFRANVEPSERYVLSVKGSTQYRFRSDDTDLSNLYAAGDWTKTGMNAGCIEAAVMSGLRAAAGLSGRPVVIIGENFGEAV